MPKIQILRFPAAAAGVTCLRTGKTPQFTSQPGQLSLLIYAERGNEYRPKCGDALRVGSKGRMAHSIYVYINVRMASIKVCDPLLTRANLSALQMSIAHITKRYTNVLTTLLIHGQVTIIFVVSVCLSVCLFVCLFVCAEFFSAVFDPISIKLGHAICLGLVVSPRI